MSEPQGQVVGLGPFSVSLDIECCGDVVLSIGAVGFEEATGRLGPEFYAVVPIEPQLKAGLEMDADAFAWWLRQSDAARQALQVVTDGTVGFALDRLNAWWPAKSARAWAYPASFDFPILAKLYKTFGKRPPWRWTETMCGRTLWKLAKERNPFVDKVESDNSLPHHALQDAKEQVRWYVEYLKALREE